MRPDDPSRIRQPGPSNRLLAAVSANSSAQNIIRSAGALAGKINCPWIALYVETPQPPGEAEHNQVAHILALAKELGAEVITTTDSDVVRSVLRVARQRNVSQIIIGKPAAPFLRLFQRDKVLRRLSRESGNIDIHVISDLKQADLPSFHYKRKFNDSTLYQYTVAVGVVCAITVLAMLLGSRLGPPLAVALIFLLGVVALGSFVGRGPTLIAALMSALFWDYFILPPVFAFRFSNFEDGLVPGMYVIVAMFMGHLTNRIRAQQEIERLGEERATALYLLTRELTDATNLDQIVQKAVRHMERVFNARIAALLSDLTEQKLFDPHAASSFTPTAEGISVAAWVLIHNQPAGKFTSIRPLADALYAPLSNNEGTVGVIGLQFSQSFPPTVHQLNLLQAFLEQMALAIDRKRLNEISERAKVLAESEHLTKTLLDSMSHEIRTPIAAIMSAASMLADLEKINGLPLKREIVGEIQEATGRLDRLVGNFIEVSHLESGMVKPKLIECEVSDLVYLVLKDMDEELSRHEVHALVGSELPLVTMDFVLMQLALGNLLSNAVLHTPPGTLIEVTAKIQSDTLNISVADTGPGIPLASMNRIFDKFYRAPNAPNGGTGLGLSLVKGFMEAQGGTVTAENRPQRGAKLTLHLPLEKKMMRVEAV